MKKLIKKILNKISKSVLKDNTHSTHRLQSYILIIPILLMVITFLVIEISQFIVAVHTGIPYRISTEIIVTFGMLLTHHISVLFQKDREIKPPSQESKPKDKSNNIDV